MNECMHPQCTAALLSVSHDLLIPDLPLPFTMHDSVYMCIYCGSAEVSMLARKGSAAILVWPFSCC